MKAVMYGAGNIGRGFIGELLCKSGYRTTFIDVNNEIISALNEKGRYTVEVLSNDGNKEIEINGVCGVNGMDVEAVSKEIASADIMATAVGVNILPRIADNIARGLEKRWDNENYSFFNIIICENLINADKFLREVITEKISDKYKEKVSELVGFVEASIGRMVPIQTDEMKKNDPLRVCVEPFNNLIVDKESFKGEIPPIINMTPYAPFDFYIKRKLFLHNMGHSMTAYLGNLKGYTYIWQAIEDPQIEAMVLRAMMSVATALSDTYNESLINLYNHVEDLLYRFANRKLGDTVYRVGRDIKRKLSPEDRLIGAIRLCKSSNINPAYLYAAVAAALNFGQDDAADIPPENVLTEISGIDKASDEFKLILEYKDLADNKDITGMLNKAKKSVNQSQNN